MLTFLLDEYRKKASREYRVRLLSLHLGLFSIICLVGFALAIPEFAILESKHRAVQIEKADSASKDTTQSIAVEIKSIKEKIAIIKDISGKQPISAIIEKALKEKGSGIAITSLSLSRGGQPGAIVLGGIAANRDALVSFTKRLQGEPSFSNANLPVSSLAKNKDIPFSISIDSKF